MVEKDCEKSKRRVQWDLEMINRIIDRRKKRSYIADDVQDRKNVSQRFSLKFKACRIDTVGTGKHQDVPKCGKKIFSRSDMDGVLE